MYIKDVEKELGLDRETVRFYIGQGLIEPERDEYNYRVYTDDVVLLLKRVMVLRDLGFGVREIKEHLEGNRNLSPEEMKAKKNALYENIKKTERAIGIIDEIIGSGEGLDFDPDLYFEKRVDKTN